MGWPGLLFGVLRHPIFLLLALVALAWSLISVNNQGHQGPPTKPDVQILASVTLKVVDGESGEVNIFSRAPFMTCKRDDRESITRASESKSDIVSKRRRRAER